MENRKEELKRLASAKTDIYVQAHCDSVGETDRLAVDTRLHLLLGVSLAESSEKQMEERINILDSWINEIRTGQQTTH